MWVPYTEMDITTALEARTLFETATFDAKLELPAPGKNKDLAKDICAMTVEGGVLLYGVRGTDPSRPTDPAPFELAGVPERIDLVAQSGIAEPPVIEVRAIASVDDPIRGYVCVLIPPSPRAPHMLVIDRDNRYWGRGATGNRLLTEGEVARLYERRERWDIDRDRLIADTFDRLPFTHAVREVGPMAVVTRPVAPGRELLRVAAGDQPIARFLSQTLVAEALKADVFPSQGTPGLGQTGSVSRAGSDLWILSSERDIASKYQARLEIGPEGSATYWHSPVMNRSQAGAHYVMEQSVTRAVYQLIATMSWLYELAGFFGPIDIGVAVIGIERARGATLIHAFDSEQSTYGANDYRRHERVTIQELRADAVGITRRLLAPLFEVISVRDYDPFTDARLL